MLPEVYPALWRYCVVLSASRVEADDLAQRTCLRALDRAAQFQSGTSLRAWLFTILRNTYYSNRRKAKREVADVDGVFTESLAEKPAHDGHMQMADFRRALGKLKDEQREALLLVGASGFSYEEAAAMCGVAVGTIKSRTNRARAQLAELLGHNDNEAMEMTDDATMSVLSASRVSSF